MPVQAKECILHYVLCFVGRKPQAHQISQQWFPQITKQICSLAIVSGKARERQSPRYEIATHDFLGIARLVIEQLRPSDFRLRYKKTWTPQSYDGC